jgi:NADPH-dependent curcumin reductase CurA
MRSDSNYFVPPFKAGSPVESGVVFKVVDSKIRTVSNGVYYSGLLPWVSPQVVTKQQIDSSTLVDTDILRSTGLGLGSYLGILGMTGERSELVLVLALAALHKTAVKLLALITARRAHCLRLHPQDC